MEPTGESQRSSTPASAVERFAAILTIVLAMLVMAGWLLDIRVLVRPDPGGRGMPFNAALCFSLAAGGLLALNAGRWWLARVLAVVTAVTAGLTVTQDIAGVNFGIDEIFIRSWLPHAPRIAPLTAGSLVVVGFATLLGVFPWRQRTGLPRAVCAGVVWTVALSAAIAYLAEVPLTYSWWSWTPMAAQAPVFLVIVAIAVMAGAWRDTVTADVPVPRWLAVPVAIATGVASILFWQALEAAEHTSGHFDSRVPPLALAMGIAASAALVAFVEWWRRSYMLALALNRSNRTLAEREQYLDVVLETLPVGVFFADAQGLIRRANRAGRQIWGGVREVGFQDYHEYKGWWSDTGERIKGEEWGLARAIRNGEVSLDEVIDIESFDGTRKTVLHAALPVDDQNGHRLGGVFMLQDITYRRQVERALEDRTRDLERSNRDLAEFAYVASHDLQEPLRMVASYVQLLERRYKDRLDGDAHDFINYAVDGAHRMQRLLSDLLAYSRAGSGAEPVDRIDLNGCVSAAIQNLDAAIRETGATIRVEDSLPAIPGNETQLTQVFQNLIGNALKFRGSAPPLIRISAVVKYRHVEVRVADNGIGLDPHHADRIFVIFQRLHERGKYPGTGVGLAICKKIVGRYGGRIWVESQPGEGATFIFTLPATGAIVTRGTAA
jgi:PAS domain S-box-containing protein